MKLEDRLDLLSKYEEHDEYHGDCDRSDGHVEFDDVKAREAIYKDLVELIGEDELEVGHKEYYDTDRAITRNKHRAELRNKLKGYCSV